MAENKNAETQEKKTDEAQKTEVDVTETQNDVSDKVKTEACRIMKANDVKEVWRCPKKGYWFTRKDYAEAHGKKMDVVMKHIEWED
jgi:hypothetical protein